MRLRTDFKTRREAEDYEALKRSAIIREDMGVLDREKLPIFETFAQRILKEVEIEKSHSKPLESATDVRASASVSSSSSALNAAARTLPTTSDGAMSS